MTLRQAALRLLWAFGMKTYVRESIYRDMKGFARCERCVAIDVDSTADDFEWQMVKALIEAGAVVTLQLFHDDVRKVMR